MQTLSCKHCHTVFEHPLKKKMYCSDSCRNLDYPKKKIDFVEDWRCAITAKLDTPCWECRGTCVTQGGHIHVKRYGKVTTLHRHLYDELFGAIPDGILVRHKCDNPICINPEHWELGTHADNMHDKTVRLRGIRGESHFRATLTDAEVLEIFNAEERYGLRSELARKYNTHWMNIQSIRIGRTWRHITNAPPPPQKLKHQKHNANDSTHPNSENEG